MVKNLLYLGAGAFGSTGILSEFKCWPTREFKVVGVDIKDETHAKHIFDKYYKVPRFDDSKFIPVIEEIVEKEELELCVYSPTVGYILLQDHQIIPVLSSSSKVLKITRDKAKTYEKFPDIAPDYILIKKGDDIYEAAKRLGYPNRELCFKPTISSGGRGFRVIAPPSYDKTREIFYERESKSITLQELNLLDFPPLLLMEKLKGKNYHVDVVADRGKLKKAVVSYRLEELSGLGYSLETTLERPEYVDIAKMIVSRLNLSYNCFFQLMGGKLLEVGGRGAGSVPIGQTFLRDALLLYEGKDVKKTVKQVKMLRQWVPLFIDKEEKNE